MYRHAVKSVIHACDNASDCGVGTFNVHWCVICMKHIQVGLLHTQEIRSGMGGGGGRRGGGAEVVPRSGPGQCIWAELHETGKLSAALEIKSAGMLLCNLVQKSGQKWEEMGGQ